MTRFGYFIVGILLSIQANAWDGMVSGTISGYSVMAGADLNSSYFRVSLVGNPILCSGGTQWAYMNSNEPNYSSLLAAIVAAKTSGASVVFYTNKDASGACHFGQIAVS